MTMTYDPSASAAMMVLASAILEDATSTTIGSQSQQQTTRLRAYYRDSSGRARAHLRVRLSAQPQHCNDVVVGDNDDGLNALLKCGCIQPAPVESSSASVSVSASELSNEVEEPNNSKSKMLDGGTTQSTATKATTDDWTLSFECTSAPTTKSNNGNGTTAVPPPPASSSSIPNSLLPCWSCWTVEGVTILHCEIERKSRPSYCSTNTSPSISTNSSGISGLIFDIEIAICGNGVGIIQKSKNNDCDVDCLEEEVGEEEEILEEGILILCATLRRRRRNTNIIMQQQELSSDDDVDARGMVESLLGIDHVSRRRNIAPVSLASGRNTMLGATIARTNPIHVHATLIPSMQLHVREVCGARSPSGSTLVEITLEHASRWHQENVIVTGISFHPGQSRLLHGGSSSVDVVSNSNEYSDTTSTKQQQQQQQQQQQLGIIDARGGKSIQGGELSVIDMSRRVRWGFVPGSAPYLPMTLEPYEAFATVIQIDAGEDVRSRAFISPISVNATLPGSGERILITTDARWTSSRVGVENSDAFRVDLSLRGGATTVCRVGAPFVVSLRILNLSVEPRDLMLLMAKDDEKRNRDLRWEQQQQSSGDGTVRSRRRRIRSDAVRSGDYYLQQRGVSSQQSSKSSNVFNTAVVSEVNGYTFGVWGLSGEDDGTARHHRDHELLAVDAALLLGEVKGQHSIQAELRFVPLREGTLDVPNLKLFDKRELKWYNCMHTLKIVATQSN